MPEIVIDGHGKPDSKSTVQVHTFRKADQFSGPVKREASWDVTADGRIRHKNFRYYATAVCSVFWRLALGALALYMIVIGSIYLTQCRVDKRIPLYMIVGGIALLPVFALAAYMIKEDRVFEGLWKLIGAFICSPFILFAIIWTIVGGVWTYGIIADVIIADDQSDQYCNPLLYISSAISVVVTIILLVIFLILAIRYFRRGVQRGVRRN